jgi:hypothetical protein
MSVDQLKDEAAYSFEGVDPSVRVTAADGRDEPEKRNAPTASVLGGV